MFRQRAGDAAREEVAVDREGRAGGELRRVGLPHDKRAERAHLAVEQADRVAVAVVAATAVRADHSGERIALMRGGRARSPRHSGLSDAEAPLADLPAGSGAPARTQARG